MAAIPSKRKAKPRHRNLPLLLLQARERVISRFRPILNAHGVTEQQWRILRVLYEREPLEPRELVELCQISSPSLTGVLRRMRQLGLASRSLVDRDRRRVRIELTARARAMVAKMLPLVDATYEEIEAITGDEFTRRLQSSLDRLIELLDAGAVSAAGRRWRFAR